MRSLTPLARTTIVLSWLFVGLACLAIVAILYWARMNRSGFHSGDGCVCAALIIGILLVSQTTWAILDEKGGRHQRDMMEQEIAAIAKVSRFIVAE